MSNFDHSMKTLFRTTLKKATRVLLLVPLVIVICNPLFGASETKAVQWEYIVAKFFDGQLTGISSLSENQKTGSYPQNAPSKFASIYPKIKSLARVESEGWELRVLQKVFDELGKDGWDLVCPIEAGVFGREKAFILKKPLVTGESKTTKGGAKQTFYDLDSVSDVNILKINEGLKAALKKHSEMLASYKFRANQISKIVVNEKKYSRNLVDEDGNRANADDLSEKDLTNFLTHEEKRLWVSLSIDLSDLLKDGKYRGNEVKQVFQSLKTDAEDFLAKNHLELLIFDISVKCEFISELESISPLRLTIQKSPDFRHYLKERPDGSGTFLKTSDSPMLKSLFDFE